MENDKELCKEITKSSRRSGKTTAIAAKVKNVEHAVNIQDTIDIAKQIETKFNVAVKLWGVKTGNVNNIQIKLPNGKVKGYEFNNTDEAFDFLSDFVEKMEA